MPSVKKPKTKPKPKVKQTVAPRARRFFHVPYAAVISRVKTFMTRRPHRSFRRTRRRDYVRSLRLPGYWSFTNEVRRTLLAHKKLFLGLALLYGILTVALIGMASQDTYAQLSEVLRETGSEIIDGDVGKLGEAGLLLTTALNGSLNTAPTDLQRFYAVLLTLLIWLTTVWLLRAIVAGRKPKLRDGLYNAGAPFISTFLVGCIMALQLLPIALAAIAFGAATSSGLLDGGVEAMVFWIGASLLAALSLYWISSTFIALVVVTLPGMYPMQAIKTAGDLVVGRRVRILLRLMWMALIALGVWVVVMIPIILLDMWIKDIWPAITWVPVVPIMLLSVSSVVVIWLSSYTYLLYRKVVDDDASPA
jgi:hypothetical protein